MFHLTASTRTQHCDGVSRRELLRVGAIGLGGLTLPGLLRLQEAAGGQAARKFGKARSAILLFLSGGPSQLDTWDMKPGAPAEIRGSFKPIATSVAGVQICEHMPRLASVVHRCTIHRAMHHDTPNHPAGSYWMMVGSPIQRPAPSGVGRSREDRPHPGSVLTKLAPGQTGLPTFVMLPEAISPRGPERPGQHAGFLGPAYDPYRVNSDPNLPEFNAGALSADPDNSPSRLGGRRKLLARLQHQDKQLDKAAARSELDPYYAKAFDLISAPKAHKAFDLAAEPAAIRDCYGRHVFGQSVLAARRLVEAGVRLVQVNWVRHDKGQGGFGFDSHRDHLNATKNDLLPPTDAAVATLIEDLHQRGLLDETLVIVMGEFGRTPRFNAKAGRDHWPWCFSVLLAGGGIRPVGAYGTSDPIAAYPRSHASSPGDLTATLYHCLGLDPHTWLQDHMGRQVRLVDGMPIAGLL